MSPRTRPVPVVTLGLVILIAFVTTAAHAHTVDLAEPEDGVGRGLQQRAKVKLIDGSAPAGGLQVPLSVVDDSVCLLSLHENVPGTSALVVEVPGGSRRAPFRVQARIGGVGDCFIAVGPVPGWAVARPTVGVPVRAPALRFRGVDETLVTHQKRDPFRVVVGVVEADGKGFDAQGIATGSCDVVVCSDDPGVVRIEDASGTDGCGTAQIQLNSHTTLIGKLATVPEPSLATTSLATLTATATCHDGSLQEVIERSLPIQVALSAANPAGPAVLAMGHQDAYSVRLRPAPSTPVTVTVSVSDTAICLVSDTGDQVGSGSKSIPVAAGNGRVPVTLQGVADGECVVSVTAPGYPSSQRTLDVDDPSIAIRHLSPSYTLGTDSDRDEDFEVVLGAASRTGGVRWTQAVRHGTSGQPVTVTSSSANVIEIERDGAGGAQQTVTVLPGQDRVARGTLAVQAVGNGCPESVTAEIGDGIQDPIDSDTKRVCVEPITAHLVRTPSLSAGLEYAYTLALSQRASVQTTLEISESSPYCALWDPQSGLARDTVNVVIDTGRRRADVVVMGEEDVSTGDCQVAWKALSGDPVEAGSDVIAVDMGQLQLESLPRHLRIVDGEEGFLVRTVNGDGKPLPVRRDFGDPLGLAVEVCSSDGGAVGLRYQGSEPPVACVTARIPRGASQTTRDDLRAVPQAERCATISASASGFEMDDQEVCVVPAIVRIRGHVAVGRDLQDTYRLQLRPRPPSPINVTLTVEPVMGNYTCALSDDPLVLGGPSLVIPLPAGAGSAEFEIQGLDDGGDSAPCRVRAEPDGPGWSAGELEVRVVTPGIRLLDFETSSYPGAQDPFQVKVGVPTPNDRRLQRAQRIHPGADPGEATGQRAQACSDDPSFARVNGQACGQAVIAKNESESPSGDLVLSALAVTEGVTVCAQATGFLTLEVGGCKEIEIAPLTISIEEVNGVNAIGAGLMDTVRLKASQTLASSVAVTVTSLHPDRCLVSPNEQTEGTDEIEVTMGAGTSKLNFQLHAFERLPNQGGAPCRLRSSSPVAPDDYACFGAVPAAGKLADLPASIKDSANNNGFKVVLGVDKKKADGTTVVHKNQKVRWRDGADGVHVKLCSSDPSAGLLDLKNQNDPKPCETVLVEKGLDHSRLTMGPNQARLQFDPQLVLDDRETRVSIEDADFDLVPVTDGERTVLVTSTAGTLSLETVNVGRNLASGSFRIEASDASPSVTVTLTTLDPDVCRVAATSNGTGQTSVLLLVPNNLSGQAGQVFAWVQGWSQSSGSVSESCTLRVTTADSRYPAPFDAEETIQIVQPAIQLSGLVTMLAHNFSDPFSVVAGIHGGGTGLALTQIVRPGASLDVSVSVDEPSLADLTSGGTTASSVDVTIPALASAVGLTLNAFATSGTVVVSAVGTTPGQVFATNAASQAVTINESTTCGLGVEIAPVLALLAVAHSAARRKRRERRPRWGS